MIEVRRVKVGLKSIVAVRIPLLTKSVIVLSGAKGYVMCGYLNLQVASRFNDAAVKITGISTIKDALASTVHSCTQEAKKLGIFKGQPIKEVLKRIV